jgi:hypothetical protein
MIKFDFEYRGFYIEGIPLDQKENGHPEDGITYTSYVYFSKQEYDNLEDYIFDLCESYDSPEELKEITQKNIDNYIKKHKLQR